jgi:hypothetical protein
VAEGRLHLTGLGLLAPHLTPDNAGGLLAAAANRTKAEIEWLLAERFPRTEWLPLVQPLPTERGSAELAPAQVGTLAGAPGHGLASGTATNGMAPGMAGAATVELAPAQVGTLAGLPGHELAPVAAGIPPARVTPLAPRRFWLQATLSQATYDKLRRAQELLSHQLPAGDIAQVLDRALDVLIAKLERRKFAAAARPRDGAGRAAAGSDLRNPRAIPARVKRAVWARDGGRCTFVGTNGHRSNRAPGSSSITWKKSRAAAAPRWRAFACAAGRTTSTRPSARSEPPSWRTGGSAPGAAGRCMPRRRPAAHRAR